MFYARLFFNPSSKIKRTASMASASFNEPPVPTCMRWFWITSRMIPYLEQRQVVHEITRTGVTYGHGWQATQGAHGIKTLETGRHNLPPENVHWSQNRWNENKYTHFIYHMRRQVEIAHNWTLLRTMACQTISNQPREERRGEESTR